MKSLQTNLSEKSRMFFSRSSRASRAIKQEKAMPERTYKEDKFIKIGRKQIF